MIKQLKLFYARLKYWYGWLKETITYALDSFRRSDVLSYLYLGGITSTIGYIATWGHIKGELFPFLAGMALATACGSFLQATAKKGNIRPITYTIEGAIINSAVILIIDLLNGWKLIG